MKNNSLKILFGCQDIKVTPRRTYSEDICDFLDAFSSAIRDDTEAKSFSDIVSFSFWIRKANIQKMRNEWRSYGNRVGRGLVFHIAPSNVPINFAYTFVFGLLSGNANIVKVSSKEFRQTDILCRLLKQITREMRFRWVEQQNVIIMYDRGEQQITDDLSKRCDARVIWGGDSTIAQIRKSPLMARATEMVFADRFSLGVFSVEKVINACDCEIKDIALKFYNDTYFMDQNACSSPHFICWIGEKERMNHAAGRFWKAVYEAAGKYDLADVKVSEKYTMLCELANQISPTGISRYENLLYVVHMDVLPKEIVNLRGKFGLFFDCCLDGLDKLKDVFCDKKIQTCAVYGVEPEDLGKMIMEHPGRGVDRIVPIGHTLDIDVIWDGYDVISELSRCITF